MGSEEVGKTRRWHDVQLFFPIIFYFFVIGCNLIKIQVVIAYKYKGINLKE